MIRFLALLAAFLAVSGEAYAGQKYAACAKVKNFRPVIKVNLELPQPLYNLKMSRQELNEGKDASHETWLKANNMQQVWKATEMETLGEAAANWSVAYSIGMTASPYDDYGTSWCPYFQAIEINLIYLTSISIPKNFKQGGCMFQHIHEHEWRHHVTNATVTNEIVERLRKDLPVILQEIETSNTYATRAVVDSRFKFMEASLKDVVNAYIMESMSREMNKRNALIDTPEEYERSGVFMEQCQGK